jgi:hypothetical protein
MQRAGFLLSVMFAGVMALAAEDSGVVSNITVLSDKGPPDVSSLSAWKTSFIREDMTDEEKALAA